jgi:streptomycin 6-kinase
MVGDYLTRWGLTPDGDPIVTRGSHFLPGLSAGMASRRRHAA